MRKLCVICLFLTVLFAFSVNAKVCFLPGVFAGDGCIEGETQIGCDGYERTSPCPSNYNQETCKDDNNRMYYKCTCKPNSIPMPDSRYKCLGNYDSSCGCAASETVCNTNIYPYENCDAYEGAVLSSDFCSEPSTGKRYYKSCDCSESIYPYDCKETGLKESRLAQKCKDSFGRTLYSYCDCIDSWTTEPCSESSSGCNTLLDDAYRGGNMGYCYSCGPATCSNATEKNLTAVFCSVTPTINTNCQSLGYTTLDNGTGLCANGIEGVKCIFDSKYMFCEGASEQQEGCALGDVYYSDGSCGSVDEYDISKIAIGVVFALSAEKGGMPYTTAEAEAEGFRAPHGRVINLRNLTSDKTTYAFDPRNPYNNSYAHLRFGLHHTDVNGLTNYSSSALMLTAFKNGDIELYSGKENTAKLASTTPAYSHCTSGSYAVGTANYNRYCAPTAAKAAISFYPPKVSRTDAIAGAGNWYLPAIGELALLYGIDVSKMTAGSNTTGARGTTKKIVNNTLSALASQKVDAAMLTDGYYWSSVEYSSLISWILTINYGARGYGNRSGNYYVRAALEF